MTLESWSKSCWDWGSPFCSRRAASSPLGLQMPGATFSALLRTAGIKAQAAQAVRLSPQHSHAHLAERESNRGAGLSQLEDSFYVVPTMSGLKYISF